VIRLELARGGTDEALAGRYAHAAATLHDWRRRNVLGRDARPAFFPYEERFASPDGDHVRRGFFARVRLHPWSDRVVLPHERTRPKPKADRRELLHTCRTQFSPIFSLFEDPGGEVAALLAEAMLATPAACGEVRSPAAAEIARSHTLWRTEAETATRLAALFQERQIFIADGHHRYETALDYRDERRAALNRRDPEAPHEFAMMLLVPANDSGLVVLPTHRLITMPGPGDRAGLVASWSTAFDVERRPLPTGDQVGEAIAAELRQRGATAHAFAVLGLEPAAVHWLTLARPPADWDAPATWRDLDVGLLQALIVDPLERRQHGTAVEFTRDPSEAVAHARSGVGRLSILLNATGVEQILAVARAGDRMPEKSTYFYPKVATGLVMYPLE
jgi:uncharacterized protein (DUF1015 family)